MKKVRGHIVLVLAAVFAAMPVSAQELSEKKDIAIFALNYYGAPVTSGGGGEVSLRSNSRTGEVSITIRGSGNQQTDAIFQQAIGAIDSRIRQVFVNLGRFNVIGLPQRLQDSDIAAFIDVIKAQKESNVDIPEEVRFGQVAFTEADFNRLVGAFYVIVPVVTSYNQELDDAGYYNTTIETSISVIDVAAYKTIAVFSLETTGSDESAFESMRDAVDSIPGQLDFNVRNTPAFQIKTGVIDIVDGDIYLEFGRNMGLLPGENYRIMRYTERAGRQSEQPIALLLIKEVDETFSVAQVIYADQAISIGDQANEFPTIGATIEPYFNAGLLSFGVSETIFYAGLRSAVTRGFYGFRPAFNVEVIFGVDEEDFADGILVSTLLGGEFNLHLGRLRPHLAFGIGPTTWIWAQDFEQTVLSHISVNAKARVGYLVSDTFEVFVEGGFNYSLSVQSYFPSIGGVVIGGGVAIY